MAAMARLGLGTENTGIKSDFVFEKVRVDEKRDRDTLVTAVRDT